MQDNEYKQFHDKVFTANSKDRAKNTAELSKKLDTLKPLEKLRVEIEGAELVTIKGVKGEDGHNPTDDELLSLIKPLIPEPIVPKDGKDYVLTAKDKKEIASKIKVPIVEKVIEKTEIIKEQPIVTNEIKEVAKYENAKQIVEKLATIKKAWLELSQIKDFKETLNEAGNNWLQQAKGFTPRALRSLYDVQITQEPSDGQAIIWDAKNKKWIVGTTLSGSAGGLQLAIPTGTVNGVNTIFSTGGNIPKIVFLDNMAYFGSGDAYTYSGGVITTNSDRPPVLDIHYLY